MTPPDRSKAQFSKRDRAEIQSCNSPFYRDEPVKRECAAKLHQDSKKLRFFSPPAKVADENAANRNIYYTK
jgi:hypothetical protein